MMILRAFLVLSVCAVSFAGCSLLKPHAESKPPEAAVADSQTAAVNPTAPVAAVQAPVVSDKKTTSISPDGTLERSGLESYEKISVNLPYADLVVTGGSVGKKAGKVSIKRLGGDASCKLFFNETNDALEITDVADAAASAHKVSGFSKNSKSAIPSVSSCHFGIEVSLHEAAALSVQVRRGAVFAEHWDEPINIRMEWGDVDVGTIGPLNVTCGRCSVTGEGVTGLVHYDVEQGNVGLTGLTGSVEGQTLGDTVLKWSKLGHESAVHLVSHAGDVLLFFPPHSPINADLSAPHGEVRSGKEGGEIKVQFHSGVNGIPVTVVAEAGDVRLYRDSKSSGK